MSRQILFKAKRIDKNEWVEGLPQQDRNGNWHNANLRN